jgi:hypothetical protein
MDGDAHALAQVAGWLGVKTQDALDDIGQAVEQFDGRGHPNLWVPMREQGRSSSCMGCNAPVK